MSETPSKGLMSVGDVKRSLGGKTCRTATSAKNDVGDATDRENTEVGRSERVHP
ncbi:hypothetical protein K378_04240 [Streptomyces sp. Amel2xB2]|nr:hypothetical protein K378_04240 [Streptomyces sp. Amel2xB2]